MFDPTVLEDLADRIAAIVCEHPVRVAIDGVDGAGKTTLADELVAPLQQHGRGVIRASIDGFHNPRAERYRRGPESPDGFYLDSFNLESLRSSILDPLGPDGSRRFRRAILDWRRDEPITTPLETAAVEAILLFDGIFLQRPELDDCWEFRIFVRTPFDVTRVRMIKRDGPETDARFETRYRPGQELYLDAVRPWDTADVVVDNG